MFDDAGTTDTTDNYRIFVNAHLELGTLMRQPSFEGFKAGVTRLIVSSAPTACLCVAGPYLYANGVAAYESNSSSISPRVSSVI